MPPMLTMSPITMSPITLSPITKGASEMHAAHHPARDDRAALYNLLRLATAVAVLAAAGSVRASSLDDYLATWKIDRQSRAVLEEPGAWSDAKQEASLRVLARLTRAPATLAEQWAGNAVPVDELAPDAQVQDRLVRIAGRAGFVTAVPLPAGQAELAGRKELDVVRIVTAAGTTVDVIADHVPRAWPRGRPIDEPATTVGLPLAKDGGPASAPATGPRLLVAAARVAWQPATPLGGLGMDYGLFDSVEDGQKLVAGDTEAFYATLAAAGRIEPAETPTGPVDDVVPLIDPGQRWIESHRGEMVTIEGVARRATRIAVDDPRRRQQLGTDHYWELFVFVPTPLIKVNERLQQDYPIVCCMRSLPPGMPTGQRIGERVRVSGFAFKRYGYPLQDLRITSSQGDEVQKDQRRETALIIGRQPAWLPAPNPASATNMLGWAFLGLAAIVGLALAFAAWSFSRDSRRHDRRTRGGLPDRIDLREP